MKKNIVRAVFSSALHYLRAHKIVSGVLGIIIVVVGYRMIAGAGTNGQTGYLTRAVQRGAIAVSIAGTGQVSASNQVDIKSKVSGTITYVGVEVGQEVKAGTLIAQVDTRDADIDLQNAKLAYEKLIQPADQATMLQAQNALTNSQQSLQKAQSDLTASYNDGFNAMANTYLDLPDVMQGLNDLFYTRDGYLGLQSMQSYQNDTLSMYRNVAGMSFDAANNAYQIALQEYKTVSRSSASSTIEQAIADTYTMTSRVSQALKDAKTAVDYFKNVQQQQNSSSTGGQSLTAATNAQSNIIMWTGKITADLSNSLDSKNTIRNGQETIINDQQDVEAKQAALTKLQNGPDPLDVAAQKLSVQQKENAYQDYFIRAPFDGVLASLDVQKNNEVSNGTVIGTFITKQKIADITLNEVDVAKIKTGNDAALTFDAIDGLTIPGKVAQINLVGTVSQGVVSYDVQVGFDAQDDRIKSGMSVTANIVTQSKNDVLFVPNAAIKTQNGSSFVQVIEGSASNGAGSQGIITAVVPRTQKVETGLSNDTNTEILSGLNEGDRVVVKTITSTSTATTAKTAPTILQSIGGSNGGGGFRGIGR